MVAMARLHDDQSAAYERRLAQVTIGGPERLSGRVEIAEYDPGWPGRYEREAARVHGALGAKVLRLEHVGSTSVPWLPAKPVIDIVLEVPDTASEPQYVPDLEEAGFVLRIREPDWFEHRLFGVSSGEVNLHVFSRGCTETGRMLSFRDRLRADVADRDLYARTKRDLASREWTFMQQYADAKGEVVSAIMSRGLGVAR